MPVYALQGSMENRSDHNGPQGSGMALEVMFTLNTTDKHSVAITAGDSLPNTDAAQRPTGSATAPNAKACVYAGTGAESVADAAEQLSIFSSEELPASPFQSQDSERDWLIRVATSRLRSLPLLTAIAPAGWSGRTSPASLAQCPTQVPIHVHRRHRWIWDATAQRWTLKTTTTQKRYTPSSHSWPRFGNSGMGSATEFWTLNTSEWNHTLVPSPSDAGVCSLSDILESWDDPATRERFKTPSALGRYLRRYWLSAKACLGILRRAARRERELPPRLREALESVANGSTPRRQRGSAP